MPSADPGRSAMLDGIQKAGGISSLKKVDRSQIRDRSAAQVGGGSDTGPHGSGLPPAGAAAAAGAGGGGMADALAAALQKRKEKVSASGKFYFFDLSFCGRPCPLLEICIIPRILTSCAYVDDEASDDEW